jgi:hypothetical protein
MVKFKEREREKNTRFDVKNKFLNVNFRVNI